MANGFSKTLLTLEGGTEQQVKQLRNQVQLVQEETEDMIRDLGKRIEALEKRLAALQKGE